MRRRDFLTSSAAALAACASKPAKRPTNVVFVLTDDQAPATLGALGNPEVQTPRSDYLARGGALMLNSFCTTPVCSPSRMTLFTGQIPSQHEVHDWISDENEGEKSLRFLDGQATLSGELAKAGYRCGLSGKWHMGDSATPQAGFDYWFAMPTGGSRYQDPEMYFEGKKSVYPGYATDVITDKALEFIEQSKDEPFFAFVSYNAPHTPYSGTPEKYLDMYRDSEFLTFPGEPLNEPIAHNLSKQNVGNRDSKMHYYAMLTAIDDNVGRLAAKLEDLGLTRTRCSST
ncbi:MAG: sulfatase-like hydrolase/transferase [Bryobacterales bacterium]